MNSWATVKLLSQTPAWINLKNLHLVQINNDQILAFGTDEQNGWQIVLG